jgi:hypothetical protein
MLGGKPNSSCLSTAQVNVPEFCYALSFLHRHLSDYPLLSQQPLFPSKKPYWEKQLILLF